MANVAIPFFVPTLMMGLFTLLVFLALRMLVNNTAIDSASGEARSDSLMNFSPLGALSCLCLPGVVSAKRLERRCSCRACGNRIAAVDVTQLYKRQTPNEIRLLVQSLHRASIDARRIEVPRTMQDLGKLHQGASLASITGRI